ncbi:MAG: hypothetical protein GEU75_15645 [Dehalococcoidia bacterium]|nr:hypothetical protein [Dehalococcoidia bacterium]
MKSCVFVLVLFVLASAVSSAGAQQPTETPQPTACDSTRPRQGGEVIIVRETEVTLPNRGEFGLRSRVFVHHTEMEVCHLETQSSVVINMTTSEALSTRIARPEGVDILKEVIASIRRLTFACKYESTRVHGGETVHPIRAMEFVLPGSDEYNWVWFPPGRLMICHIESNSSILVTTPPAPVIEEVRREVGDPEGAAILDDILRAVQASQISPPRAGDASLR